MNTTRTLIETIHTAMDWGNVANGFDALADHYEGNPDIADANESARLARTVASAYRSNPIKDETGTTIAANMKGIDLRPHGRIIDEKIWPSATREYTGQAAENVISILHNVRKFATHTL